jgi:hypothetical protein
MLWASKGRAATMADMRRTAQLHRTAALLFHSRSAALARGDKWHPDAAVVTINVKKV